MDSLYGGMAILICGKMRAGKTAMAQHLAEHYGFTKYAIADNIKRLHYVVEGSNTKDREWLQNLGASLRVVFGPDFWVDRLIETIDHENKLFVVVDDIRYENELESLYYYFMGRGMDVTTLLVTVSQELQVIRGAELGRMHHESERMATSLQNQYGESVSFDFQVQNADLLSRSATIPMKVLDGCLRLPEFTREGISVLGLEAHRHLYRSNQELTWHQLSIPVEGTSDETMETVYMNEESLWKTC